MEEANIYQSSGFFLFWCRSVPSASGQPNWTHATLGDRCASRLGGVPWNSSASFQGERVNGDIAR